MTGWERKARRREKALYFSSTIGTFFLLFEPRASHFYLVPGPWKLCCWPCWEYLQPGGVLSEPSCHAVRKPKPYGGGLCRCSRQQSTPAQPESARPRHRNNASRGFLPTSPSFPTPPSSSPPAEPSPHGVETSPPRSASSSWPTESTSKIKYVVVFRTG